MSHTPSSPAPPPEVPAEHNADSCPFGHIDGMCAGEAFGYNVEPEEPQTIITPHGSIIQILPPVPLPDPIEISDEERLEAARRYIENKYGEQTMMYQIDPKIPTPSGDEVQDQAALYGTAIHERIERHYTDMKQSDPDEETCISCGGPRAEDPIRGRCHRNDFHYNFPGQQPTVREYKAMVQRATDGSDPLVREPKGKP